MNEELKAFVQAYIDGEDVEYINHYENNNEYSKVTSLATFEYPTLVFRIKPKAEDKWQRVIDEKYLCKFWTTNPEVNVIPTIGYLARKELVGYVDGKGDRHDKCEVLREKGIKQPYFQGDDIPKFKDEGVLYHKDNSVTMFYDSETYADYTDWSEVIAYIEV